MKVEVTQEDIDRGKPRSSCSCAIAVALKRLSPEEFDDTPIQVSPMSGVVRIWDPVLENFVPRYDLPQEAREFASAFDLNETVSPIVFEMPPHLILPCPQ